MVHPFGEDRFEAVSSDPALLRCPRFAGDRDLAAVLAGRLRLAAPGTRPFPAPVRSRGPAVRKIQEVLIAAGYPLPRFGADGRFGRETGAAVSRFKADRRIEPADPVVGAGTIRALDVTCLRPPSGCGSLEDVRVAVIGGGFAGLMAAWSLQSGGTRVTVFEANSRLAGRVRTDQTFIPGKVVEAGAELIGTNHPTWISLARSFGLTLTPITKKEDYKKLYVRLRFGDTDLSDKEKKQLDLDLKPVLQQIGRDAEKVDALQPWKSPDAAALDAKSVAERFDDNDMFGPASSVARRYLEFILENDQCAPPSRQSYLGLLSAVRAHAMGSDMLGYWDCTETHRCAGGNQQLATHLAKGLRDVRLNTPVVSIDIESGSVRVEFTRTSATAGENFDYVVLAAPPAVWPRINSSPPFRPQDYTLAHGPAVKFLSSFNRKFWEADKLAPSALWDRIGSLWEGTDKQDRLPGGFGLTVYSGGQYVLDAATYETRMKTLYPKYGDNVRRKLFVNWPTEPWICSGYAIPAPGQVTTVTRNLSLPYLGRLFFAGEQASPGFFGYMEGALQSGVLAAYRIAAAVRANCRSGATAGAGARSAGARARQAADSSGAFAESVIGPCADVPVPPSARPRLLIRGSVSPAVRDAQRRLNVFHLSEVAAGRAGLVDAPLREDCIFGRRTFNAVLSFQRQVFPGRPSEHDGKIGPKTWAELDRVPPPSPPAPVTAPAPPSPALTGPNPTPRPCCMLASRFLRDASTMGGHSDLGGIVYTGKAGFVDVGHVRDVVDLTAFVYQEIHRVSGASGTRIRTTEGEARLTSLVPATEWLEVARSIAFDDALGHEIATYSNGVGPCRTDILSAGGHNSSFSPEDLCSNFLGTVVAARALAARGTFATAADRELQSLLSTLDAQSLAETRSAFGLIDGRWVDPGLGILNNCYLKRRNFTRDPFKAGHRSDAPTPAFVTSAFTFTSAYEYAHRSGFTRANFATEIATIQTDARSRYGPDFDRP